MRLVVGTDKTQLMTLCRSQGPDIEKALMERIQVIDHRVFQMLSPKPPETGVIAIAARPLINPRDLLHTPRQSPLIILEKPSHMGNIGAVIRVAAAVGASGVWILGEHSPWHPAAIRGAAGLQFALPIAHSNGDHEKIFSQLHSDVVHGTLIGVHPNGPSLSSGSIAGNSILVFGSESEGLSRPMLDAVHQRISIPMESGVSSLNLATAAAIVLYGWKLAGL